MKHRAIDLTQIIFLVIIAVISSNTSVYAASPGSLDSSFGKAGVVKTNISGTDSIKDIAVQEDGKIIAVGQSSSAGGFLIVRYLVNGTLDTTFDGDGIAFVNMGAGDIAQDVKVGIDGKITVSGTLVDNISGVTRLNPNGALDTTFGTNGRLLISNFQSRGLELQSDGKIVLGGNSFVANLDLTVIRLNSNGSFDTTFDTDGIATTNVSGTDFLEDIKLQPNGKIVGVGYNDFFSIVVRYKTDGSLDTSFSDDGIAVNNFSSQDEYIFSLVIDTFSGTITTVGIFQNPFIMVIVSYKPDGSLNTEFSGDGILTITNPMKFGKDIVQQSDRKFVCVGSISTNNSTAVQITRINLDGTIDTTFGTNGFVKLNNEPSGFDRSAVLVGDKLLIGNPANNAADFGIERINLSSTPSESGDFDGDGFTDVAVFRPNSATWIILNSLDNTVKFVPFGANGDVPLDGDFDGDGRNDPAIYRPSVGEWWVLRSSDNSVSAVQFGTSTDKAVPGDYDKDGKTDVAIFRPSTGEWRILRSSTNGTTFFGFPFGSNGDIPITRQGL